MFAYDFPLLSVFWTMLIFFGFFLMISSSSGASSTTSVGAITTVGQALGRFSFCSSHCS
jgi:hypothetical protein